MQLNDISVFITGGGSGLGAAAAKATAAKGAKVAVFDMNGENAGKIATEVKGVALTGDVADDEQIKTALAKAATAHGTARVHSPSTSQKIR
ncbi:SDR family NAD(P)-dependent oxidoreductase [Bradyrhizobium tropiciagri]|uniref:SDR family NAD(P)-dependent oxidoreductase n=1 Tax=Bradyrhizobium tropiciagri TaxID=312253 RepID=UPI001BAC91CB|nr:SDR family NAD(P)-dependent oxidoreductase [Bradyrhizobium tropiciagri]MBR0898955.1 SDR family NAD(P)-dependent oxidoreductase [Bradyrhizobium tropiciagri]